MATPAQRTNTWTLDEWYDQSVAGTTGGYTWSGEYYTFGASTYGQLGLNQQGPSVKRSSPVQVPGGFIYSANDGQSLFGIKSDNTLWAWGRAPSGALGLNSPSNAHKSSPTQVGTDTNWSMVSIASGYNAAAIKTDGTLWGWGWNNKGSIGDNSTVYKSSPIQVGTDTTWAYVKAGNRDMIATKTDGTLWSWGYNGYGQLGLSQSLPVNLSSPTQIPGTTWDASSQYTIASGGVSVAGAIKTDGTLWTWGWGVDGTLGQGGTTNYSSPRQVGSATTWKYLDFSKWDGRFAMGVKTDGTLWAWGWNYYGEHGTNSRTNTNEPVQVGTDTTWDVPYAGYNQAGCTKTDGTAWAWGKAAGGSLGIDKSLSPANIMFSSPCQVSGTNWAQLVITNEGQAGSGIQGG